MAVDARPTISSGEFWRSDYWSPHRSRGANQLAHAAAGGVILVSPVRYPYVSRWINSDCQRSNYATSGIAASGRDRRSVSGEFRDIGGAIAIEVRDPHITITVDRGVVGEIQTTAGITIHGRQQRTVGIHFNHCVRIWNDYPDIIRSVYRQVHCAVQITGRNVSQLKRHRTGGVELGDGVVIRTHGPDLAF